MTQQLAVYEHAREALAAAVKFDEVTQLHTDAQKAEAYARIAKDRKLQADATEIVARAERKLGILLRKAKGDGLMSQGGRPSERSKVSEPETGADAEPVFDSSSFGSGPGQPLTFTLSEIGVDKKLSSRAQKAAALDDDAFEEAVQDRREKILAADAPVVSPPKPKVVKVEKPAPVKALEPRRWHQFAYSVLALCMASDRVGSEAILKLGEFCGVLERDGDTVDFTPEAVEAMGNLATAALKALDGEDHQTQHPVSHATSERPETASRSGGDDSTVRGARTEATAVTAEKTAPIRLNRVQEDEIIRKGYAAKAPLAELMAATGLSSNIIKGRARRMGLSSRDRQREIARGQMQAINARKGDAGGAP